MSLEAGEHVDAAAVEGGEMLGAERGRRTRRVPEAEQTWVWENEEKRRGMMPRCWAAVGPDSEAAGGEAPGDRQGPLSEGTLTLSESCEASALSTGSLGRISGPGKDRRAARPLYPGPWSSRPVVASLRMFPTTHPARGCRRETLLRGGWSLSGASCDLTQFQLVP